MNKIRKGDKVFISTGKDKGKDGIVSEVLANGKILVEGINMVKNMFHLTQILVFKAVL